MRFVAILAAMLLCACATKPGDNMLYYKGVYAPGTVQIAQDGAFIARASVWNARDWEIAGQAALYRLEQAARDRGYSHFVVDGSHKENAYGTQYILNGTVYMSETAPFGALPLTEMRHALQYQDEEQVAVAVSAPADPVKPQPVRAAPAEEPRDLLEEELPEGEEPMVIEAPDFVTMRPTRRPLG